MATENDLLIAGLSQGLLLLGYATQEIQKMLEEDAQIQEQIREILASPDLTDEEKRSLIQQYR